MRNAFLALVLLSSVAASAAPLRYIAVGDSYSSGEGIQASDSFPDQLVAALPALTLTANLARSGFTSTHAITLELPVFEKAQPEFATLLIGTNDWFSGVPPETFRQNFGQICDRMIAALPDRRFLVVLTLPDTTVSPVWSQYKTGRDARAALGKFNSIIRAEAKKRRLAIVELFKLSQKAEGKPELFAPDGLHPSAEQYAQWVKLIAPVAKRALSSARVLPHPPLQKP